MARKLKIGVIGSGRIGRIHAENLSFHIPDAEITAISDVRLAAAKTAAEAFGVPGVFTDHRMILDDKSIEAVVICSPTSTHARIIEEASSSGKHIFCEKPIDLDLAVIRRAIGAAAKAGVKLQIGFNRRFDPEFKRAAEVVRSGGVGTPHLVRITSRDPDIPPREYLKESGGLFLDMTIHDFDMVRFLTGEEIVEVYAVGGALIDPGLSEIGDIDTAVTTLRTTSGAICVIDNSRRSAYGYDQRAEVFGTKGAVSVVNRAPVETVLWDASGRRRDLPHHFFLERYKEAYIAEMREFVSCVLEDRVPPVGGEDGLKAAILGVAAKKSVAEKRAVRVLEEKSEQYAA